MRKLIFFLSLLVPALGFAQRYSMDWHKISGGGGTSAGGNYSLSGTVGQPDTGPSLGGGNFSLSGGFWSQISVTQTPGAPVLTARVSGGGVVISWAAPAAGFLLELNSNLSNAAGWNAAGLSLSTNNGVISVTVPISPGNKFFRLRHP